MKIILKELSDSVKTFTRKYDPEKMKLDSAKFKMFHLHPLRVTVRAKLKNNRLLIAVEYICYMEFECVRCLKKFYTDIRNRFNLEYSVSKQQEFVDITSQIREEIILNYPVKPLCEKSCKGLCKICGVNLNFENCGCNEKETFKHFSKLNLTN